MRNGLQEDQAGGGWVCLPHAQAASVQRVKVVCWHIETSPVRRVRIAHDGVHCAKRCMQHHTDTVSEVAGVPDQHAGPARVGSCCWVHSAVCVLGALLW